jgi:soluble lytic murein transglycosylase
VKVRGEHKQTQILNALAKSVHGKFCLLSLSALLLSSPALGQSETGFVYPFEAEELTILSKAEELLRNNKAAEAADLIFPLSLGGHHGPDILQVRTWALYHSEAYLELTLILEELPHLSGELRYLRGAARLRTGDWTGGLADLQSLWWEESDNLWGFSALRELADSNLPGTYSAYERTVIQKYIPQVTYNTRQLSRANNPRRIFRKLKRRAPTKGTLSIELLFAEGLGFLHQENFRAASRTLSRALQSKPHSNLQRAIELNLAEALRFRGAYQTALMHFDHVASTGEDELRYRALSQAGRMAIHYRRYEEARVRYQALLLTNPLGPAREKALWGLGWVAYRNDEFNNARQFFKTLFQENPFGPHAPQACYWGARSAQRMDLDSKAYGEYVALIERFPVDYYSHRASQMISRLKRKGIEKIPAVLPDKPTDPRVSHIEGLAQSGLTKKVEKALREILPYAGQYLSPVELDTLYLTARGAGLNRLSGKVRGMRQRRFPNRDQSSIRTLAANFPHTYVELIRKEARRYRVEEALVVALARQESAFNPRAVSPVGALGLLQLMPQTAQSMMSKKDQNTPVTRDEILNPALNAKLGSRYLSKMLKAFGGKVEYALAAYNAGPGAVGRWRRQYGNLPPEIFVEEIPYKETRQYVRKVLAWKRKFSFMRKHRNLLYSPKKTKRLPKTKKKKSPG